MNKNINYINIKKIERTIKSLQENNMKGYFVNSKEEMIATINEITKEGELVACGGSETLKDVGVLDYLRSERFDFLDRYEPGLTPKEIKEIYRKSFYADTFFTSTNAITENGELYNVDGNGNRVAAMLYGPDKVIVIAGVNKIVRDIDEAIKRNEEICAPANTQRLNTKTPCVTTGKCMDCKSSDRICCEYTLIKRQRVSNRIHVVLLNEYVGY